jgi:hypothetical protein
MNNFKEPLKKIVKQKAKYEKDKKELTKLRQQLKSKSK